MNRQKIEAGSKKIGDEIFGRKIKNLGKIFTQSIEDEDACIFGLEPGMKNEIEFQYAYFD